MQVLRYGRRWTELPQDLPDAWSHFMQSPRSARDMAAEVSGHLLAEKQRLSMVFLTFHALGLRLGLCGQI